jgi:hypothetical protein
MGLAASMRGLNNRLICVSPPCCGSASSTGRGGSACVASEEAMESLTHDLLMTIDGKPVVGRATLDVLANHEDGISRRTFDPSWLRSQTSR